MAPEIQIQATRVSPPPTWALLQRQLIQTMEEAAPLMVEQYAEKGGVFYYADCVDDLYEQCYNWGLFYAMGADERVLDLALQQWNATSRFFDDSIVSRVHPRFIPQIHNEYSTAGEPGGAEWHHLGEGNMAFYDFGVADPTISENVRRARRFAAIHIGEDPEAPNYDPEHKVFRSPIQTSRGPYLKTTIEHVISWLQGGTGDDYRYYGVRASLYPMVKDLKPDWHEDPGRRKEIVKLFEGIVLNGDVANSLGATALVTNAYLYSGEDKYKQWVLDYTDAWMERMRRNNGIMPDNVGPTGKIGENRRGNWWGGLYGWNSYCGFNILFHSLTIAAECALLLSGDAGYLDLLRSQIKVLLDNAITREDGQLLLATRHTPEGWGYYQWDPSPERGHLKAFRLQELAHLYHASMAAEDYALIERIWKTDQERDWNEVPIEGEKNHGATELARFQYYDGENPDWPEKILRAEYENAQAALEIIQNEERDAATLIADNFCPPNPVFTKGLTQVMMGAPQSVYNGGLLRATVRYFDVERTRPGLPPDVAALVDELASEKVGIQLFNLNTSETRNLIVQAGAFGEHHFTELRFEEEGRDRAETKIIPVDSKHFSIQLPPGTNIRLEVGMRRFANRPTYAFPWHGDKIPVPFLP